MLSFPSFRYTRRVALSCLALLLLPTLASGQNASESRQKTFHGRAALQLPDRTDAGDWYGTWYYLSVDAQIAIWMRTNDKNEPEMKIRFADIKRSGGFITDWNLRASYRPVGGEATFELRIQERDANVIRGDWDWRVIKENATRVEASTVEMYRAGDGRNLVMFFDGFVRKIETGKDVYNFPANQAWTFRKASRRLVRWVELPF